MPRFHNLHAHRPAPPAPSVSPEMASALTSVPMLTAACNWRQQIAALQDPQAEDVGQQMQRIFEGLRQPYPALTK